MRHSGFKLILRALLAAPLLLATPALSQTATKPVLTLHGAHQVLAAARAQAAKGAGTGAIAVVDDGGNLIALDRLDNTFPAGAAVAEGKARTAATFRKPTRDFEKSIKDGRVALLGVAHMTPLQGGVPITVNGQVVGAIGVSGAASAQQDDEIASAGAAVFDKVASAAPTSAPSTPARARPVLAVLLATAVSLIRAVTA